MSDKKKKILKDNFRFILGVIIGLIISGTCVFGATTIIKSADVTYSTATSGGTSSNVQGAIDELYKKAKSLSGDTGKLYQESILNGAYPELSRDLIPVTIDEDGTVKYANVNTKWYSYAEKKWANAVVLVGYPSKEYKTGDEIAEKDIESYFVWIPRFEYKVWNLSNPSEHSFDSLVDGTISGSGSGGSNASHVTNLFNNRLIDIKFTSKSVTSGRSSAGQSSCTGPKHGGGKVGSYSTHPAFAFNCEINGFWVGKFETGFNQINASTGGGCGCVGSGMGLDYPITNASTWSASYSYINSRESNRIIIKPNVYSWRIPFIKKESEECLPFYAVANYIPSLNSHMMKNTEWGAVAYLSHSAYGKGSKVNINNNPYYQTGYAVAPDVSNIQTSSYSVPYNTSAGVLASTTGNITGVFDMAGGSKEIMATGIGISGTKNAWGLGAYVQANAYARYIDDYTYPDIANNINYKKAIQGDATFELGDMYKFGNTNHTWYGEKTDMTNEQYSLVLRGGKHSDNFEAGIFNSDPGVDANNFVGEVAFRVILSPE